MSLAQHAPLPQQSNARRHAGCFGPRHERQTRRTGRRRRVSARRRGGGRERGRLQWRPGRPDGAARAAGAGGAPHDLIAAHLGARGEQHPRTIQRLRAAVGGGEPAARFARRTRRQRKLRCKRRSTACGPDAGTGRRQPGQRDDHHARANGQPTLGGPGCQRRGRDARHGAAARPAPDPVCRQGEFSRGGRSRRGRHHDSVDRCSRGFTSRPGRIRP